MSELTGEFIGRYMVFNVDGEDPTTDESVCVEITDSSDETEISFNIGKRRMYLRWRQSDFARALRERKNGLL